MGIRGWIAALLLLVACNDSDQTFMDNCKQDGHSADYCACILVRQNADCSKYDS